MKLTGLHLLLTYECTFECDHCFVWSSPRQSGTMTLDQIELLLSQAEALGGVEWIYFEGGEPLLYYPVLLGGVRAAAERGFRVGIVSNAYWAPEVKDAMEWLRPMAGFVDQLSVSGDLYHGSEKFRREVQNAARPPGSWASPSGSSALSSPKRSTPRAVGRLPEGESAVIYRGRAVEKLAVRAPKRTWSEFTHCPYEDLREPGRVHVDPLGHVHICQGISLGNVSRTTLKEICAAYDPDSHPVTGPLLAGGPVELVRREGLPHADVYADGCHLCDETRRRLRERYPEILAPDQMYGPIGDQAPTSALSTP